MRYVNLGATGLRVSRICLGMMSYGKHASREWTLDEKGAEPIVRRAVEGGITFFDTADVYNGGQSEVITGKLLRKLFEMREEYVVATKVNGQTMPGENGRGLSRKHIMASIDASLNRLELEYVDLYQIHRWDPRTPIEETMEALHDVVKAGKARYIGASSMYAWQFAKAQAVASTRFVSMQNHYNLVYREEEREMIPQCLDQGSRCCRGARWRGGCLPATARAAESASPPARTLTRSRIRCTSPRPTLRSSTAQPRSPPDAALRVPRSRSRGCCRSRVSPPRSSARPSSSTSTTRWPPRR
jgi:aryl-alcohol dehydrogenase-like predicted oxidoreductase